MEQTYFLITLIAALTIGVRSTNSGITFAQEKIKHHKLVILLSLQLQK
jgi:hypothetical protein